MANLNRVADLLKEAVSVLSSTTASTSHAPRSPATEVPSTSTLRTMFAPYRRRSSHAAVFTPKTTWTHKFCCLANPYQETVPDKVSKKNLTDAGLGEKKITLEKNKDSQYLRETLHGHFPKLKDGGGYELLRSNARISLEKINMPSEGYTTRFLADASGLGGAICFIRPIQESLSMEADMDVEASEDCIKELCKGCHQDVPVVYLKEHVAMCYDLKDSDNEHVNKKVKKDMPICHFACVLEKTSDDITLTKPENTGQCPVCQEMFNIDMLQVHASTCGVTEKVDVTEKVEAERSLDDELEGVLIKLGEHKQSWTINVVRRFFIRTATEELTDAVPADWDKPIIIHFIGEEGVDAGGLTREFFSLLFKNSSIFENSSFRLDSGLLHSKMYLLIGKAVARAIIAGHPGPKCLNQLIANYICTGKEPDFSQATEDLVRRSDVSSAISEISTCTAENLNDIADKHADMLESSGFRKVLTTATVQEAVNALIAHFAFYNVMGPLLQFMEGLKLQGLLTVLQKHKESVKFFTPDAVCATDVQNFYKPSYAADSDLKQKEEMILYNFGKFLKKAERGTISTTWIDPHDGSESQVVLNTGHVLQALLGCEHLPRSEECGIIEFNHNSNNLTTVNTCAPSITFSQTSVIQEYEIFEKHFLGLIVGAVGFGIV